VEEPLQFFCLTCESECICAECALHGKHRGHDVINVRDAAKQLPERASELNSLACIRAKELSGVLDDVLREKSDIATKCTTSRKELRCGFEKIRAGLESEEKALMGEVQRCIVEIAEILKPEEHQAESKLQEARAVLSRHHSAGDAISSLNAFVKLNEVLAIPPAPAHSGISFDNLKEQLQRGFKARLASLASVAAHIDSLPSQGLKPAPKREGLQDTEQQEADQENQKPRTPNFCQVATMQNNRAKPFESLQGWKYAQADGPAVRPSRNTLTSWLAPQE
jgi:hypothetical protein